MLEQGPLLLTTIVLCATSGLLGLVAALLFHDRKSATQVSGSTSWAQRMTTILFVVGCLCGMLGISKVFLGSDHLEIVRWPTPIPNGDFWLQADPLSGFFLIPILWVTMLGSIYGLEYWKESEHRSNSHKLQVFYGLLAASLTVLVLARNSITFLVGWEGMAISAFFLVGTQDDEDDVREAAWLYLAASHAATLALIAMFALLYGATGNYDLVPLPSDALENGLATCIFLLALAGFGLKAGLMPLHFWLPSAHAMAPSHVSAVMSGVLIKSGIYGLVRITWVLTEPPLWWGELLLVLGAISAVLGVAYALGQHDLKRLLAYHSIENIGIIVIGLGLAMIGRTMDEPIWIILGLSGCLLHVWNHALFKSLLFLSAGSVIHACHTREIEQLGGLAKNMPWTAGFFLLGATAICGLPPLNGFVSEFFIYLGLFQTLGIGSGREFLAATFVLPVLAMMGALAIACFVKVFGVVFLGVSRKAYDHPARESGWAMRGPMLALSICCLAIGLGPTLVAPILDQSVSVWMQQQHNPQVAPPAHSAMLDHVAPLVQLSMMAVVLILLLTAGAVLLNQHFRKHPSNWTETWGCGYTAPTPRMQYTASSIAQLLVELLAWPLQLKVEKPQIKQYFPHAASFRSHVPEVVLESAVMPVVHGLGRWLFWFRIVQQGSVQIYVLYIFAMLVFLLLFWR